jgi:hypothetical protein
MAKMRRQAARKKKKKSAARKTKAVRKDRPGRQAA